MLITNTQEMMLRAKESSGRTWADVRKALGNKRTNYVSLAHRGKAMMRSYVEIMDALGYDIGLYLMKKVAEPQEK